MPLLVNERELVRYVPKDHHAIFWQRFWDKVHVGEPDFDPLQGEDLRPHLTPEEADSLWVNRDPAEIEEPTCPWWCWTGAKHRVGSLRHNADITHGAVYGYLITHGKGYHTHRLAWAYFSGGDIPHHFRVRRELHCRMFTLDTDFNQLCMYPGCLRLERAGKIPSPEEAYSVRLDDEDLIEPWFQDYELIAGVWQMTGYSRGNPRYVEIEA